jgi:hypothetical protein
MKPSRRELFALADEYAPRAERAIFTHCLRRGGAHGSTGIVELKHPQRRARDPRREPRVEAVSEFLAALRSAVPGAGKGACQDGFAALIASTRTAILGREAAQAGGTVLWSDIA